MLDWIAQAREISQVHTFPNEEHAPRGEMSWDDARLAAAKEWAARSCAEIARLPATATFIAYSHLPMAWRPAAA